MGKRKESTLASEPVILHEWHLTLLVASGISGDLAVQVIKSADVALRQQTHGLDRELQNRYPGCSPNTTVES